ncbi:MAG: hypothetical protein E6474_08625 [Actinomyces sp.]|nr:hypothetical protein [Actinomyces sp.]
MIPAYGFTRPDTNVSCAGFVTIGCFGGSLKSAAHGTLVDA